MPLRQRAIKLVAISGLLHIDQRFQKSATLNFNDSSNESNFTTQRTEKYEEFEIL